MPIPYEIPVVEWREPMSGEPDADVETEAGIRWQRCPSDVIVVVAPLDPGGTPGSVGDPHPAVVVVIVPSAIVENRPAERLAGNPIPSIVCPCPTAVEIGAPAIMNVCGTPRIESCVKLKPFSIGRQ